MNQRSLSTAADRRPSIVNAALTAFARGGYAGTTVSDIAREAGISSAYVLKLFGGKEALFIAALDSCFERIEKQLASAVKDDTSQTPAEILNAMAGSYAELIADRTLLLIQVHAQSAATIPAVGKAFRTGLSRITYFAKERSGASDSEVQRFIAYGQLCHLVVTAGVADIDQDWAHILAGGLRHPETQKEKP